MIASSTHDGASLRAHEFFLARQPIVDRHQALVAYELLFRNAAVNGAVITDDLSATASVIAHTSQLGVDKVIGDSIAFLNVDAVVLASDIFQLLPREKVVLEIIETTRATPETLQRVQQLAEQGFRFALDDVTTDSPDTRRFLPWIEIVKIDLWNTSPLALPTLVNQFRLAGKKLLAEKVETRAQFDSCLELGFDYFQGYYFAKPLILRGKKLLPSQLAIMQLMTLVHSGADNAALESCIKQDVSLCFNLLKLVNSPSVGVRRRIDSMPQALLVLGRRQLQRWLQILLYAEPAGLKRQNSPLLALAATRGKLLELIARHTRPGERSVADAAFTVGIMSLMDALLSLPMPEILEQLPVAEPVVEALLHRRGALGDMLRLVDQMEHVETAEPGFGELIEKLKLSSEALYDLQLSAFSWSDNLTRYAA